MPDEYDEGGGYADYDTEAYQPPAEASGALELQKELNRAELFRMIVNPDFRDRDQMGIGEVGGDKRLNPFTRELKVSNINEHQLGLAAELTDIARNLGELHAFRIALELLAFRDTMLSLSASKDGMLIKAMNTEYQFRKVETSRDRMQKRWFRKDRSGMDGPVY